MLTHECKGNASYKHLSIKQENIDLYYKNKPRIFATVPKDMFILRKYALRLKNRIKDYNTQHPDEPMSDEYGKMEIPVAG